ncbi:hypothetical protein ACYATP_00150 [Lactobacillaceae bacterium Melli_B4]
MKIKKSFIMVILCAVAFFGITGMYKARADTWHEGNPSVLNNHIWISDFMKPKGKLTYKYHYIRYVGSPNKYVGFHPMSVIYNHDRKVSATGASTVNEYSFPHYRQVKHNVYQIITGSFQRGNKGLKEELKDLKSYGSYQLVKIYNSNKVALWNVSGINKQYMGIYHKTSKMPF